VKSKNGARKIGSGLLGKTGALAFCGIAKRKG
jgi:hypothetical protein